MELELRTARLLIPPLDASDAEWSVEMFTDPEVMRYIYGDDVYTEAQVIEEMSLAVRRDGGGCIGVWAIVHQAMPWLGVSATVARRQRRHGLESGRR